MSYRVVRTYSRKHYSQKLLWSVESRPFMNRREADQWCEFSQGEWDREHPRQPATFFVVEVLNAQGAEDGRVG